ncbi:MAG: hypothetical protein CSA22_10760 [Deltaproteobacteria bacterium]|nr:MAG: hypothetical protein CSA22_10760 [Deltaproteobacteria bacterium]
MKKWIVLTASIVLNIILGGIYAWSKLSPPLIENYHMSNANAGLVFGATIAIFTLTMIPSGTFVNKYGPRITAVIGAVFFAAGYTVAAMSGGSFAMIFAGVSILSGIGIGTAYVCPLTVGMKWFPDNKGLITGVAVAGFGGGAIVLSNLAKYLLVSQGWDILDVFKLIGFGFGGVAILAALLLSEPESAETGQTAAESEPKNLKAYLFDKTYLLLCLGIFAGTFAGLLVIGHLGNILKESGFSETNAALGISVFAIGNAAGRIFWGQVHDKLKTTLTVILSLMCMVLALIPLAFKLPTAVIMLDVAFIGMSFGACFVVYASSIVVHFGTEMFPRLYPICFLGYGVAGIVGSPVGGIIRDTTGSFTIGIFVSIAIVIAALTVITVSKKALNEPHA